MKSLHTLLAVVFFILIGCRDQHKKATDPDSGNGENTTINETKEISKESKFWFEAIKTKSPDDIKMNYAADAIKIISVNTTIIGSGQIAEYYGHQTENITSIESLYRTEANEKRGIDYELIQFKTTASEEYIQLLIWKLEGARKVREFEYTGKGDLAGSEIDTTSISERRDLWIKLCNENNAENLVKELYSSNAIYFNHKPLIVGTKNIIEEYAYMNNEDYHLTLQSLKVELVAENIAFEIGQCKGSYGGKYILVWKKEADEKWKIFIDSNI